MHAAVDQTLQSTSTQMPALPAIMPVNQSQVFHSDAFVMLMRAKRKQVERLLLLGHLFIGCVVRFAHSLGNEFN